MYTSFYIKVFRLVFIIFSVSYFLGIIIYILFDNFGQALSESDSENYFNYYSV